MDTTTQLIRTQTVMLSELMKMVQRKDDAIMEYSVCAMVQHATADDTPAAVEAAAPVDAASPIDAATPENAAPSDSVAAPVDAAAHASQSKVSPPEGQSKVTPKPLRKRSTPESQSKVAPKEPAVDAHEIPNCSRGRGRPKGYTPPTKRAKTTGLAQQFKVMNMKRKMALSKRLWDGLSKDDQELLAYLLYGGMDTHVGCVWARVVQKQRRSTSILDKYVVINLKEARRWAEYRIHTGHCAPRCLTRQHSRDLVDYVQDGVFAAVKPVLVHTKDALKQKGKCIVLPLDLYLYLLAAAESIASFGRYALQSTALRQPPTDKEREEWEEEEELVRSWLMNQWQKRCVNLVACFGHSAWRAYQKWRIPRTGYDQPPQAAGSTSSSAATSASEDNLFSDSESFSCEEDNDIWRLIKENYGEKILK